MEDKFEQISTKPGFMKHNGGVLFRKISNTEFEFKTTIDKNKLNSAGITHGGYICSIIDAGAGTAAHRASNNSPCVTISLDVKFIGPTKIGDGVKTDNLSQIGHNVQIGDNTLICAQVGIAGSSVIGKNVVLGGQTGVSDNIFVGDNVITGGATKVLSNIPSGRVMLGYPAMKMETQLEVYRNLRKLPKLLKDLKDLKKAVFKSSKID